MCVTNIENGDYIKVNGVDFGTGVTTFEARVASNTRGGKIELYLGSLNGTLAGTCNVSGTGGWQNWVSSSCSVKGTKGKNDHYLKFTGGTGTLFNFNWWRFQPPVTNVHGSSINKKADPINFFINENIITFTLPSSIKVVHERLNIGLFDLQGHLIDKLSAEKNAATMYTVLLNKKNMQTGLYVIRVSTENRQRFQNTLLLK